METTPPATEPESLLGAPKGEAAPAEFVPFDLEKFEWPEDLTVDDEMKQELAKIASTYNISADAAKAFVGMHSQIMQKAVDGLAAEQTAEWNDHVNGFVQETKALYGPKLDEVITKCERVLDEFGSDDLRNELVATGLGSHPAVFKFLEKLADAIGEGTPLAASAEPEKKSGLAALYPTMTAKG